MRWLNRLFLLCVFIPTLIFSQSSAPDIHWISPTNGAVLFYDGTQWIYDGATGIDTCFRVEFFSYYGFDTTSLWIKISRNGEPLEEIFGYEKEFWTDNALALGDFDLLGLEPGGYYQLCAHIANEYGEDSIECIEFQTEMYPDTCPPIIVGWNLMPDTAECFNNNFSLMICDNTLDCPAATGVDPESIELTINIPGYPPIDATPHIYAYPSGPAHCFEVNFNADYPCDSLNYILHPGLTFEVCVMARDSIGNYLPEPVCTTFTVCEDTCPPDVYSLPSTLDSSTLYFDGTHWHTEAGDTMWSIYFNDNYSACPPSPFDPAFIGLLIKMCDDTASPSFVPASEVDIEFDPGYCRMTGNGYGLFDDLGLECGNCYEIYAQAGDIYENIATSYSRITIFTEECVPDTCPPYIAEWNPTPDDTTCFPYDGEMWFIVEDPSTEFCICSGIYMLDAFIYNNGITYHLMPSEGLIPVEIDPPCVMKYILDEAYYDLVPGTIGTLFVHGYDSMGGMFDDAIEFEVCDTFTPPVDTCPPYVDHWFPEDTMCLPIDEQIGALICDNDTACDNAGIIADSITVWARIDGDTIIDVTAECYFDPAGDCIYVVWQHTGTVFPLDTDIELCILAIDNAGNEFYDCFNWHTCGDTCPPVVNWYVPTREETLIFVDGGWAHQDSMYIDHSFHVNFIENECPGTGLNDTTISIMIRNCDDTTWTVIDGYDYTSSWDYGDAWGNFDLLGLEPDMCYEICAEIMDNAGNWGEGCVTFYTEPVLEDTCPPVVDGWNPAHGDTFCFEGPISFYLVDPTTFASGDCPICSEIVRASIDVSLTAHGDTFYLGDGSGLLIEEEDTCILYIELDNAYYSLNHGDFVELCVDASDGAGNHMSECIEFWVCDTLPPEDLCPPFVVEWNPAHHDTFCFEGPIDFTIVDPTESLECPICTGIDDSTLEAVLIAHGDTFEFYMGDGLILDPLDPCRLYVHLHPDFYELYHGDFVELCVGASDGAGNHMSECIEFWVCDTLPPEDICPPIVELEHPIEVPCIPPDSGHIIMDVFDPEDSICYPSGVDTSSIVVTMSLGTTTPIDITDECDISLMAYGFWRINWFYADLPPGELVTVCVYAEDNAGNFTDPEFCWEWNVCEEEIDSCPPIVELEHPIEVPCIPPDSGHIIMDVFDPEDSICYPSGVDTSSIVVTMSLGITTPIDITDECDISLMTYGFWRINWFYTELPPGELVTICVYAEDNAGNFTDPEFCWEWNVCEEEIDSCPPIVEGWYPAYGDTYCFEGPIHAMLVDPSVLTGASDCPFCSGIDLSSIEAVLIASDGASDVDSFYFHHGSGLVIDPAGSCAVYVGLESGAYWLEPGDVVEFCIAANDYAGNHLYDCVEFLVCDTTMPADTCPPVFVEWLPDTCLPPHGEFIVHIQDPIDSIDCPFSSGISRTDYSVIVMFDSETLDVSGSVDIVSWAEYHSVEISWGPAAFVYPFDTDIIVCIEIMDYAGNTVEECHTYHTCEGVPDTCPPFVIEWHPGHEDTLCPPDAPIWFRIIDPVDTLGCVCSGVDFSSIFVSLYNEGTTFELTPDSGLFHEPLDICGIDVSLLHEYFTLEPGTGASLYVAGSDFAGNTFETWIAFWVCDTHTVDDTCPPNVMWSVPSSEIIDTLHFVSGHWQTILGETEFDLNIIENGCPPTGVEEYHILFGGCEDTLTEIFGYEVYEGPDYVYAWDSFDDLGLEPGHCYKLCAHAMDGAGNWSDGCVTFYTSDESVDMCPPVVTSWFPVSDTCLPIDAALGLMLNDPLSEECPMVSGVDYSSIEVTVQIGPDSPIDITEECSISPYGMYVGVEWLPAEDFPGGTSVTLCIAAADLDGNWMDSCYTWRTCGEPTEDICPPIVLLRYPIIDTCLIPTDYIEFFAFDNPDTPCFVSGVDESSIVVTAGIGDGPVEDITDECTIDGGPYEGYIIEWDYSDLVPGTPVEICVTVEDFAGNEIIECFDWLVCEEETTDVCPPVVDWLSISDGDTLVPITTFIGFDLLDPYGPDCPICTGIDETSVVLTISTGTETYEFDISSGLYVYSVECMTYVVLDTSIAILEPDMDYELCIDAADNAGNVMATYCIDFSTAPAGSMDIWPPCFDDWTPAFGDTGVPVDTDIGVAVCDLCESSELSSGVDSIEAMIWAITDTDTIYYTYTMILDPIFCDGYYAVFELSADLPECAIVYAIVCATDGADNHNCDTLIFHTTCLPETTDIWPPCVEGIIPEPGDTIPPDADIGVMFCDICEGAEFVTGVDSASITMTVNGVDVTDELLLAELDCYGWAAHWEHDPLEFGAYTICAEAADFAGNSVDTCWEFDVWTDTTYEFVIIEPLPETWVNNEFKQIIGYFSDGPIPPDFSFTVDEVEYTLSSPEVTLLGDTLYFIPSTPWEDGDTVCYDIADETGCFFIDLTSPVIEFIEPLCGDSLEEPPTTLILEIGDELSGVDETTIGVQISTSAGSWSFHPGMTGVSWDGSELQIDLEIIGITLSGYVTIYAWAGDSPDYTYDLYGPPIPNYAFEECGFYIAPVVTAIITGDVVDIATGLPVEGAMILVIPYIHGWPGWLYPGEFGVVISTMTDAAGHYSVEVGMGAYMVMMIPSIPGPVLFWDGHYFPLDADPIIVDYTSPDTFWCDFEAGLIEPLARTLEHHQASGTIVNPDGEPVENGFVVFISTDDDEEELSISADLTGPEGAFSCPVKNGNYWVTAFRPGYFPTYLGDTWTWEDADSIIISGTDYTDIEMTLQPISADVGACAVYGTVYEIIDSIYTMETEPMRGTIVYLTEPSTGNLKYAGVSDFEGEYLIQNVNDGVYRLVANRSYYLPQGEWDLITASDDIAHDIYLYHRETGIEEENRKVPERVKILGAHPNPFNANTTIHFYIPTNGDATLEIVDVLGQKVSTLFEGSISAGRYVAIWSAENCASGVYFAKLRLGEITVTTKLILTK